MTTEAIRKREPIWRRKGFIRWISDLCAQQTKVQPYIDPMQGDGASLIQERPAPARRSVYAIQEVLAARRTGFREKRRGKKVACARRPAVTRNENRYIYTDMD